MEDNCSCRFGNCCCEGIQAAVQEYLADKDRASAQAVEDMGRTAENAWDMVPCQGFHMARDSILVLGKAAPGTGDKMVWENIAAHHMVAESLENSPDAAAGMVCNLNSRVLEGYSNSIHSFLDKPHNLDRLRPWKKAEQENQVACCWEPPWDCIAYTRCSYTRMHNLRLRIHLIRKKTVAAVSVGLCCRPVYCCRAVLGLACDIYGQNQGLGCQMALTK